MALTKFLMASSTESGRTNSTKANELRSPGGGVSINTTHSRWDASLTIATRHMPVEHLDFYDRPAAAHDFLQVIVSPHERKVAHEDGASVFVVRLEEVMSLGGNTLAGRTNGYGLGVKLDDSVGRVVLEILQGI